MKNLWTLLLLPRLPLCLFDFATIFTNKPTPSKFFNCAACERKLWFQRMFKFGTFFLFLILLHTIFLYWEEKCTSSRTSIPSPLSPPSFILFRHTVRTKSFFNLPKISTLQQISMDYFLSSLVSKERHHHLTQDILHAVWEEWRSDEILSGSIVSDGGLCRGRVLGWAGA